MYRSILFLILRSNVVPGVLGPVGDHSASPPDEPKSIHPPASPWGTCIIAPWQSIGRYHTDDPRRCMHYCLRQDDCWVLGYSNETKKCFLRNAICPEREKRSGWIMSVYSTNEKFIQEFLAKEPTNLWDMKQTGHNVIMMMIYLYTEV